MSIEWFDCNCSFGFPAIPVFRYAATAGDLLEEMRWCGIDRALVYHASMRFDSPVVGNQRVLEGVEGRPELMPTWAILPCQTGEFPHPDDLLPAMAANKVRALRAFPNEHRYALDALTFKDLMLALQNRCIPLFVKLDLRGIGRFLASFPNQVVVAVNQGPHSLERYLRPLLDAYPNLYVDTSYYMVDGLIEAFCARYGSHRLLFGTAYPDNCSGAALLRLAHADISEKDRAAIAGGNLKRLLAEARI
jgi:hypothetical protein